MFLKNSHCGILVNKRLKLNLGGLTWVQPIVLLLGGGVFVVDQNPASLSLGLLDLFSGFDHTLPHLRVGSDILLIVILVFFSAAVRVHTCVSLAYLLEYFLSLQGERHLLGCCFVS